MNPEARNRRSAFAHAIVFGAVSFVPSCTSGPTTAEPAGDSGIVDSSRSDASGGSGPEGDDGGAGQDVGTGETGSGTSDASAAGQEAGPGGGQGSDAGSGRAVAVASLGASTPADVTALVYPNGGNLKAIGGYTNWTNTNGNDWPTVKPGLDGHNAAGAVPVFSWGSGNCDSCVANGGSDAYLHEWTANFKSLPYRVVIRLDWEMNGSWYGFSPGQNGNTSADYVAMWRHVHDLFVADGVTNVTWFWCPNTADGIGDFTPDYPGDAYVDYVGVDLYNWGTFHTGNQWATFTQLMTKSYALLEALTTSKPYVLGEIGSCPTTYNGGTGGTKEGWITSAFLTEIPTTFQRIVAFMWFDEFKAPGECDFEINSTSAVLAAFQQVAASPLWQGQFP